MSAFRGKADITKTWHLGASTWAVPLSGSRAGIVKMSSLTRSGRLRLEAPSLQHVYLLAHST